MTKLQQYFSYFLWGFTGMALADGEGATKETMTQPNSSPSQFTQQIVFCPPLSALIKNPETRAWSAPHGWKSYEMSFEDKLTQFSGAQWRGTNVGQIFCVYRGESPTSFPVLLAYNVLAFTPQGGKWSDNLGGYENCESSDQKECPFLIRIKPKEENLYEQAERLKRPAATSNRPGF